MSRSFPIRFGVDPWQQNCTWQEFLDFFLEAEDLGYDTAWCMDHILPVYNGIEGPCLEAYACLAAIAAKTKRIHIGALMTGNSYRHPGVLAKTAVTVDHISNGRLLFGFGAGWAEIEHTMYAIPFPPRGERLRRMAEAMDLIKLLWTQERTTYSGKYYQVKDAVFEPKPVQKPHPPIWIGGKGEKVTLKVAAKHANNWNGGGSMPLSVLRHKLSVLEQHCRDIGRNPNEIEISTQISLWMDDKAAAEENIKWWANRYNTTSEDARAGVLVGSPEEIVQQIKRLAREGVTHFVFPFSDPRSMRKTMVKFAREVMPAFRRKQKAKEVIGR